MNELDERPAYHFERSVTKLVFDRRADVGHIAIDVKAEDNIIQIFDEIPVTIRGSSGLRFDGVRKAGENVLERSPYGDKLQGTLMSSKLGMQPVKVPAMIIKATAHNDLRWQASLRTNNC